MALESCNDGICPFSALHQLHPSFALLVFSISVSWSPPKGLLGAGRCGAPIQSPQLLGKALCSRGTLYAHPKPTFLVSSPEKYRAPPALEEIHLLLILSPSNSTRKLLLIGFKNRTFKLDFYGLLKSTVLIPTHTWSLPLPGPIQLPRSSSTQALQAPRQKLYRFTSSALTLAFSPWLPAIVQLLSHIPCTHGWDILCLLF